MEELIKSFRLGVVQIFGILVPGLALLTCLAYPIWLSQGAGDSLLLLKDWKSHRIEVAAGALTLAYVLGFVIRLIPTEWLDYFSIGWRNRRQKGESPRLIGDYPYANFQDILSYAGLKGLSRYVKWTKDGPRPTRAQVNSLKLLVASENPNLASALASTEANIRMMFGLFVAGFAALGVLVGSLLFQGIMGGSWQQPIRGFWMLLVAIVFSLFMILLTFTSTRCTELVRLMTALRVCAAKRGSAVDSVMSEFEYSEDAEKDAESKKQS